MKAMNDDRETLCDKNTGKDWDRQLLFAGVYADDWFVLWGWQELNDTSQCPNRRILFSRMTCNKKEAACFDKCNVV